MIMQTFGPVRTIVSYAWALSPLYTLGMATSITMLIAALRIRSLFLWRAQLFYLGLVIIGFFTAGSADPTEDMIFNVVFLALTTVGTGHALFLRRKVFSPADSFLR